MNQKRAVIIGAGPAGLTAAYEFVTRTGIVPIVLEKSEAMGGISRTIQYKGNRIDIGGHRFFSKSDRVMNWWLKILPLAVLCRALNRFPINRRHARLKASAAGPTRERRIRSCCCGSASPESTFLRQFFDYPIKLSGDTISKLGPVKMAKIGASYMWSVLFPIKNEQNLEQFFMNRFGKELYLTFFKSYTEKVWGVPCKEISAAWGRSESRVFDHENTCNIYQDRHFAKKKTADMSQKDVETSLIEQFMYPKFGPGQMWEEVARQSQGAGGPGADRLEGHADSYRGRPCYRRESCEQEDG